ncbi:MAG TPA: hypothetical protein DCE41_34695 [Cytophagales bacterium]|nr:hypothetical protein [Cytophagales bacterium]HAA17523.1 hypothetical protein [Cytophagales bacterium]HAP64172.1 hypothetical protein [Cytophagales bacterium]
MHHFLSLAPLYLLLLLGSHKNYAQEKATASITLENMAAVLDTVWQQEQTPIRNRDSLIDLHGVDHKEVAVYQAQYRENHAINIIKVRLILDTYGWPDPGTTGSNGNLTICNVLQHADQETRQYYIPLMKQAVLDQKLEAALLVRAEDRLATDRGEPQIYGGQMKYYPETESFNVWPVYDPVNVDQRRAEIGLGPLAEHLKNRFNFEWNLEEQIERTEAFERARMNQPK